MQERGQNILLGGYSPSHGERGARAYTGGLGAMPPVGSRGKDPRQEVREAKLPEAKSYLKIK